MIPLQFSFSTCVGKLMTKVNLEHKQLEEKDNTNAFTKEKVYKRDSAESALLSVKSFRKIFGTPAKCVNPTVTRLRLIYLRYSTLCVEIMRKVFKSLGFVRNSRISFTPLQMFILNFS